MVGDIRNIAVSRSVGDHRIFFLIKLQREKRGAAMKFTWCVKKKIVSHRYSSARPCPTRNHCLI